MLIMLKLMYLLIGDFYMDILPIHNILNNIYDKAENLNKLLNDLHYKTCFQSYHNHVISINGNYYQQKYYMPVITVDNKGDICFNFDLIAFEFYITKEQMNHINLDRLIHDYQMQLSIYEYADCTIDIYQIGDYKQEILNKIQQSSDHKFGISIDVTSLSYSEIIRHFHIVSTFLNK